MILRHGDKYSYIDDNYDTTLPLENVLAADRLIQTFRGTPDFERAVPLADCVQVDLLPDLWVKWSLTSINGVQIKKNLRGRFR